MPQLLHYWERAFLGLRRATSEGCDSGTFGLISMVFLLNTPRPGVDENVLASDPTCPITSPDALETVLIMVGRKFILNNYLQIDMDDFIYRLFFFQPRKLIIFFVFSSFVYRKKRDATFRGKYELMKDTIRISL